MPELKITAEKVKAAAAQCPDAANVLKQLFPEVFVDEKPQYIEVTESKTFDVRSGSYSLSNLRHKGYYLPVFYKHNDYEWAVERDDKGCDVLVQRLKKS